MNFKDIDKLIKTFLTSFMLVFIFGCASPRKMSDVIQHPNDSTLSKEVLSLEIKKFEAFDRIMSEMNCVGTLQNKIDSISSRKSMDNVELYIYFPCHPVKRITSIEDFTCFVKQRKEHLVNLYQQKECKKSP